MERCREGSDTSPIAKVRRSNRKDSETISGEVPRAVSIPSLDGSRRPPTESVGGGFFASKLVSRHCDEPKTEAFLNRLQAGHCERVAMLIAASSAHSRPSRSMLTDSSVADCQPNRRFVGSCPFHSMPFVSGDVEERSGLQFDFTIVESQPSCTLQHHDELVFGLIVPKAIR